MINYYLIFINILAFLLFGLDKYKAIKNKWRIKERDLILSAFFGGSIGALLGMIIFRHKIRRIKFIILIPLTLIINILLYVIFIETKISLL